MADRDRIRVVVIEHDDGTFAAQCLEYDICMQAASYDELKTRLADQIEVERMIGREHTGRDFGDIAPAPELFHKMWDGGKALNDGDSESFRKAA